MDDLISRQATIDALIDDLSYYGSGDERAFGMSRAIGIVEKLLPAQPERIRGRWTEKTVSENPQACGIREWQSAKCSVCGKYHSTPYLYSFTEYAFCPLCGADMRGEQE